MKPIRIQRKRTKGWKLVSPNGLPIVYVGRGTDWGNYTEEKTARAFESETKLLQAIFSNHYDKIRRELKGKNLACWCPLNQPCHADILLKIANS